MPRKVWVPNVGYDPFTPQGESLYLWDFPLIVDCTVVVRFLVRCNSSSPLSVWPFYSLLWRSFLLVFRSFSQGIDSCVAVDLVRLWEEVSSGSSYATILNYTSMCSMSCLRNTSLLQSHKFILLYGLQKLYTFAILIYIFNLLGIGFCEIKFHNFYIWITICPSTMYWKIHPSLYDMQCLLCPESVSYGLHVWDRSNESCAGCVFSSIEKFVIPVLTQHCSSYKEFIIAHGL